MRQTWGSGGVCSDVLTLRLRHRRGSATRKCCCLPELCMCCTLREACAGLGGERPAPLTLLQSPVQRLGRG